jgi:hypothetical protein
MMMTLNQEGRSLNSAYDELQITEDIMNKVDSETIKQPLDYARLDSKSIPCEIDQGKGGLIGRFKRWLNKPAGV